MSRSRVLKFTGTGHKLFLLAEREPDAAETIREILSAVEMGLLNDDIEDRRAAAKCIESLVRELRASGYLDKKDQTS